jgi:hypothetical protein
MDMNYEIGETIATRELYLTEDDGTKRVIVIRLGKPRTFPDSSDYYAPFQVTGIGSERVFCAGGIDAFQALQAVMPIISAQLSALNAACEGRLRWEGDEMGALGFPENSET